MSDDGVTTERQPSSWEQHRFLVMITIAIAIALFLVSAALALYASSGAAQLDLSRPGYMSVREQAVRSDQFDSFSASGALTEEVVSDFGKLYDTQAKRATNVDSFGGDVMSDQILRLDNSEVSAAN